MLRLGVCLALVGGVMGALLATPALPAAAAFEQDEGIVLGDLDELAIPYGYRCRFVDCPADWRFGIYACEDGPYVGCYFEYDWTCWSVCWHW